MTEPQQNWSITVGKSSVNLLKDDLVAFAKQADESDHPTLHALAWFLGENGEPELCERIMDEVPIRMPQSPYVWVHDDDDWDLVPRALVGTMPFKEASERIAGIGVERNKPGTHSFVVLSDGTQMLMEDYRAKHLPTDDDEA